MKILIVVEEAALRTVLRDRFQGCGFEILAAGSGAEGLTMAKQGDLDVVLIDLHIATHNNAYVLTMLKQDPQLKEIPIFVLSDTGDEEDVNEITKLGVEDYFVRQQCPINDVIEKITKKLAS
jgi:two-component system NtrC family response regulator